MLWSHYKPTPWAKDSDLARHRLDDRFCSAFSFTFAFMFRNSGKARMKEKEKGETGNILITVLNYFPLCGKHKLLSILQANQMLHENVWLAQLIMGGLGLRVAHFHTMAP
jgi:hypothetical protein